jgi:quercetin dioxygenase-like cupin family protein
MSEAKTCRLYRWSDVTEERMKGTITRRLVTGDKMMIAQVMLRKGDEVPWHSHHNEQLTYILSGALRFRLGDESGEELVVRAGEVLVIPSNVPHTAYALEDTLDVDVFSPPREDWLDGTDAYLRRG